MPRVLNHIRNHICDISLTNWMAKKYLNNLLLLGSYIHLMTPGEKVKKQILDTKQDPWNSNLQTVRNKENNQQEKKEPTLETPSKFVGWMDGFDPQWKFGVLCVVSAVQIHFYVVTMVTITYENSLRLKLLLGQLFQTIANQICEFSSRVVVKVALPKKSICYKRKIVYIYFFPPELSL